VWNYLGQKGTSSDKLWGSFRALLPERSPMQLGLMNSLICERSHDKNKTASHVLCDRRVFTEARFWHVWLQIIKPSDYQKSPLSKVQSIIQMAGLQKASWTVLSITQYMKCNICEKTGFYADLEPCMWSTTQIYSQLTLSLPPPTYRTQIALHPERVILYTYATRICTPFFKDTLHNLCVTSDKIPCIS
jgi:hypothetical protein